MVRATLNFTLPDESSEFDAALQGHSAISLLWNIDSHCRSIIAHCDPDEDERRLASEIRAMIADSGVDIE